MVNLFYTTALLLLKAVVYSGIALTTACLFFLAYKVFGLIGADVLGLICMASLGFSLLDHIPRYPDLAWAASDWTHARLVRDLARYVRRR
jgi:hypothetical protein